MHLGFLSRIASVAEALSMLLRHFALILDVSTLLAGIVGVFQVSKQVKLSLASQLPERCLWQHSHSTKVTLRFLDCKGSFSIVTLGIFAGCPRMQFKKACLLLPPNCFEAEQKLVLLLHV